MQADLMETDEVLVIEFGETGVADELALRVPARIIEYQPQKYAALPVHTTMALVERPELVVVPGAYEFGLGMLKWQDRWISVIDLGALLHGVPSVDSGARPHVMVLAYQTAPNQALQYAGIATTSLPVTVSVADEQQALLPEDSPLWPVIAISCFTHEGRAIPILDTSRLFDLEF